MAFLGYIKWRKGCKVQHTCSYRPYCDAFYVIVFPFIVIKQHFADTDAIACITPVFAFFFLSFFLTHLLFDFNENSNQLFRMYVGNILDSRKYVSKNSTYILIPTTHIENGSKISTFHLLIDISCASGCIPRIRSSLFYIVFHILD